MNVRWYILIIAIPIIPLGLARELKYIVPVSAIGALFIVLGLMATFYYAFLDLPSIETRKYFSTVQDLPIFFSTILFAMEGIGTVLPIENSMKNPEHFLGTFGVLNISMTLCVTLFTFVGFFGYLKYGDDTEGSITLNLPKDTFSESVKILVALSILFTYGLQFCVPSEIVWNHLKSHISTKYENSVYYLMRGSMIIGTVIIAIIVPNLAPVIGLIGSVCFSMLGLWIPAFIEIITYWEEDVSKWLYIKNIFIMVIAVISLITGGYISLQEIIHTNNKT